MPRPLQPVAVAVLPELVIGGAGHDLHAQAGDRPGVQDAAEGAGGEDVRLDVLDFLGIDRRRSGGLHRPPDPLGIDVRHQQARPGRGELAGEVEADIAATLDRHRPAGEIVRAPALERGGFHRADHALGGVRGRIVEDAGDVPGLLADRLHVRRLVPTSSPAV